MALTKKQQRAVEEIRKYAKDSTFATGSYFIGADVVVRPQTEAGPRAEAAAELSRRFNAWFATWIEPQLQIIEGTKEDANVTTSQP